MDEIVKLREQYQSLLAEAKKLMSEFAGKEMPSETAKRVDELLGKSDEVKLQIERSKRIKDGDAFVGEPDELKAAHLGWRPSGPDEGNERVDEKAWREVEIKTWSITPEGFVIPETKKVRYHVPLAVEARGYSSAFEAYLRKGKTELGPNDRKTLAEGTDTAGGFLVPEDYQVELIKKIATLATVRQYARVAPTSRDVAQWPKISYTTDDKYTSGVKITWAGETPATSTAHRVTDPVFGMYNIPVHTAMASMPISLNLLEDSAFDIVGISQDLFAEAFALGENDKFWNGSGTGEPRGIIKAAEGSTTESDHIECISEATAKTMTADELIDVCYSLPAQYERNAKWFMNKSTEKAIRKLTSTGGDYLWPIIPQVGNLGAAPRMLFEFPVVRDEFVPDAAGSASKVAVIFGDLKGYLILDRVGLSVQRVSEPYVEQNCMVLLGRKRVGGQVIEPWRMKGYKTLAST